MSWLHDLLVANLSNTQAKILGFCRLNPGPSVQELRKYAQVIDLDPQLLACDLIELLYRRLIYPLGSIRLETLLPSIVDLTEEGKTLASGYPTLTWEEEIKYVSLNVKESGEEPEPPAIDNLLEEDIETLSSAYLFFGKEKSGKEWGLDVLEVSLAAIRGYYRLRQLGGFRDALRTWFGQLESEHQLFQMLRTIFEINQYEGSFGEELRRQAPQTLVPIYWQIAGDALPIGADAESFERNLVALLNQLNTLGEAYKVEAPDRSMLDKISNRLVDLIGFAFNLNNTDIYFQAIDLLQCYLQLCASMLKHEDTAAEFEKRSGYSELVETAWQAALYLEAFSKAVHLPDGSLSEARKITIGITLKTIRIVTLPARAKLDQSNKRTADHIPWACILLDSVQAKENLLESFENLKTLLDREGEATKSVPRDLVISDHRLNEFKLLISDVGKRVGEKVDDVGERVNHFGKHLQLILQMTRRSISIALHSEEALSAICGIVGESNELLEVLNQEVNNTNLDIRTQLKAILQNVATLESASAEEKQQMSEALSKLLTQKNTAKMVVELPLIPGFLKYKDEFSVKLDMKKWFSTLI